MVTSTSRPNTPQLPPEQLRDNAEIVFIYGRNAKLRDVALRDSPANLFATMDGRIKEFADVCRGLRTGGPSKITVERI